MITDRHKYAFVTICCGLWLLFLMLCGTTVNAAAVAIDTTATDFNQTQISNDIVVFPMKAAIADQQQQQKQQDEMLNALPVATTKTTTAATTTTVRNFSPRVDYNNNEWRPLGHGDPLKNDPTYDYSPPALERVRYWADNGSGSGVDKETKKQSLPQDVLRNKTKSEILLLGVSSERLRGNQHANLVKSLKGYETPLLQPKYTSIRRSYYAHQQQQQQQQQQKQQAMQFQQYMPHTHLMPPPPMSMQPQQQQQHHLPQQQQLIKSAPAANVAAAKGDYRHNMVHNYMAPGMSTSTSMHAMSMHSKPYYSYTSSHPAVSVSTAPWMHHSSSVATSQRMPAAAYDTHHQESTQHYSYISRPAAGTTTTYHTSSYSPNAIHSTASKQHAAAAAVPRKPWLHELLQKELVKPTAPAANTKYHLANMRPHNEGGVYSFAPHGVSTTYAPITYTPVSFVSAPPTIKTTTTTTTTTASSKPIFITPTPPPLNIAAAGGFRPMTSTPNIIMQPSYIPTTTPTTTTTTSSRLLIPTVSNLAQRPTVSPSIEMTTDALFKHYKQPKKPLLGPMYLIIEGHSKVKTYGKNELDPHQPKIVPIIPKREPVVRIADPYERRGTVESFQVKHLHTKTTTPMPATTTTKMSTTEKTTTTTTTSKPTTTTTPKANPTTTTTKTITTTTTPKSSKSKTSSVATAPTAAEVINTSATATSDVSSVGVATAGAAAAPPTGMEDLLSLLNIFEDEPLTTTTTMATTILKPVTTKAPTTITTLKNTKPVAQQPEPRISTKVDTISSILDNNDDDDAAMSEFVTTELPPRGTRQIFDYDQLPESRLKELNVDGVETMDYEYADDDDDDNVDDNASSVETDLKESTAHTFLKRIDSFLDNDDDDDGIEDDLSDAIAQTTNNDEEESDEFEDLTAQIENVT